ncbi:MAG: NAD-dependent succinate-semialdehyde dehydrogenase [Ignavibacteriales bacterium]|nr:NAD-dependent succinate-semialdehyde dehydrogenase [Ignavibacteriales bacterium]
MAIETVNPATGKLVKTFKPFTNEKVDSIINETHSAFGKWRATSFAERKKLMLNAAKILKNEKEKYAKILTIEMGKPITQAISEVEKCAWVCEYYAENAESILKNEIIETDASESYVQFDPIGIVLAVMPWNFPYWQVFRFAAPALMAGNAGLLKHASNVPKSALAIEEVFQKAGYPKSIFRTLLINSNQVDNVIENPKVKATTLTGSEHAGSMVAAKSGKLLKKSVLELGVSDQFIILKDENLDEAIRTAVTARLLNNGQSCIAAKRFVVVKEIAKVFEEKFVEKMEEVKIGNPMDRETELGPMAREDLLLELHEQVVQSIKKGAKLLIGGKRLDRKGYYYPATVLANVKRGMPAYEDELFGPVASVIKVKNEEEAIKVANNTKFGLGASLWTRDFKKAKTLAKSIDSGSVFINGMVKSDPRLPFGGVKLSGFGRELSHYGIKEFVNIKTVWVK